MTMINAVRKGLNPRLLMHQSHSFSTSSSSSSSNGLLKLAWHKYLNALSRRPLRTKAMASAIIFFSSDSAAQYIMTEKETGCHRWDIPRAASGAAFGVVATGFLHIWWGFLEALVEARLPVARYRLANTMTKVMVDQSLGADKKKRLGEIWVDTQSKANEMIWPTMFLHWRVWPIVHSFNFYFIPLHHRVLVQNLVLVGWSGCKSNGVYMSKMLNLRFCLTRIL
jgi:protein Mpv17